MSHSVGGRLPTALAHEVEELGAFSVRHIAVADQVILAAEVRSVPLVLYIDRDTYPAQPPRIEIAREWLGHRRGRPVRGLEGQEHWNRTLGIGALLRELEQRFRDEPPQPKKRRLASLRLLLQSIREWFQSLLHRIPWHRLPGRRGRVSVKNLPAAIQARYRDIITDKTSRIERYKQAVTQLMTQWQHKTADLERWTRQVQALERDEKARLTEAERLVDRLLAQGQTQEQIQGNAHYQRCLTAYEEVSADRLERQERLAELEKDHEEHQAKIREHEASIEALEHELEELKDEASDVAADLATVELEQEIADLRAGISRADSDEELRRLLRQFRKAKASVRITREATEFDDELQDAEYLEAARKVEAARRFEDSVGLNETAGREPLRE